MGVQELLDNISNLGVDAVHFDGRSRAPSINRAGRMASSDGAASGWAPNGRQPMLDVHRAMSVKAGEHHDMLIQSKSAALTA